MMIINKMAAQVPVPTRLISTLYTAFITFSTIISGEVYI